MLLNVFRVIGGATRQAEVRFQEERDRAAPASSPVSQAVDR